MSKKEHQLQVKEEVGFQLLESGSFERELLKSIYHDSYYEFFKKAYSILLAGEHFSDNWHIKYLCDRLQEEEIRIEERRVREKDLVINIPFRSAKSLICTVVFPVWCWTRDQSRKFICTSYSASLALEHAQLARTLINTEWFQDLYSDKIVFEGDQNAAGFYKIKGGGFRKSVGMGGQITGSGADIIIVDDPQSPKMASSEVEIKNVKSFYDATLYSRLNQPELGIRIVIMQRLNESDLSGHLMDTNPDKIDHICIPVEVDMNNLEKENISPKELIKFYDKDGLYWPDRFSKQVTQDFIKRLGSREAAGQLYQRPAPQEGNLVKEAWFDIVDPSTLERDLRYEPMMFYIDPAESEEQQEAGDSTGICVAYKKDNIIYICNIITVKKAFYELVKFIPEFASQNLYSQFSMIKIEPKSSGKSVISQLKSSTMLNVVATQLQFDDKGRQIDKVQRMNVLTPLLESRRVKFLQGNYLTPFMNNLKVFPNGKHDDDVDAFMYCVADLLTQSDFDFAFVG